MSGTTNNTSGFEIERQENCRVAYTLNNKQPVGCTIIGDQPLFYMDYEGDFIEDEVLEYENMDFGEAAQLEKELRTLKREMDLLDKFSEDFSKIEKERQERFLDVASDITKPKEEANYASTKALIDILSKSRMAVAYLEEVKKYDIEIKYNGQIETAIYDRNAGLILINPEIDLIDQTLLLAKELRRHWQHRQGALIDPLMFHPDNAILISRIQEADLSVSIVRIAWELQLSGYKEAWERIENSSLSDLGHALAREAFLDFRTLNNGVASAAVFESWFISDRCQKQDKHLIQQMLSDNDKYVFDFDKSETAVTPTLIAALGTMPYGKNYLAQHTMALIEDPVFTEVRDRSNANFLWFIKFERTCRETEQELQFASDLSTGDVHAPGSHTGIQGSDNGKEIASNAKVIQLYTGDAEEKRSKGKLLDSKAKKGKSAEIVYLRRWSAE